MSSARVTLDDPVFVGRLRQFSRGTPFVHVPRTATRPTVIRDVADVTAVKADAAVNTVNTISSPAANPASASRAASAAVAPQRPPRAVQPTATAPAMPRLDHSKVLQRNITTAPVVRQKKERKPLAQKLLMAMACMVFMAGIAVAAVGFKTNKHVEAQVQAVTQQVQDDSVAEDKPTEDAIRNHRVDPSFPRTIRITKLGVYARVQRQGIDSKGALKAPGNVHDTGWYENSSKPGETGAMLLDGHVSGPTKPGVFHDIKKLKAGDLIEVERGDGQKFTYKVVKSTVTETAKTDMYAALTPVTDGKAGLNLITCTGKYDAKTKEYQQRLIVFAEQV